MRALVLEEFGGPFTRKDVATPRIGPHEALVRVRNVGVCGTDLKIRAGRMGLNVLPLIIGHEVAGEVAEMRSERPRHRSSRGSIDGSTRTRDWQRQR